MHRVQKVFVSSRWYSEIFIYKLLFAHAGHLIFHRVMLGKFKNGKLQRYCSTDIALLANKTFLLIICVSIIKTRGPDSLINSILASHPAAPGSITSISQVFSEKFFR